MKSVKWRWVIGRLLLILVVLFTAIVSTAARPAQAIEKDAQDRALRAAAFIVILDDNKEVMGSGSGTVLTPDGLILTNFHVVGEPDSGKLHNSDGLLAVGLLEDPTASPEINFLAQVVAGDPDLDLAVLRLKSYLNGSPLPSNLVLTSVPLGDANKLNFGDEIIVIGFPGVGFSGTQDVISLTYSKGNVAGFITEKGIKTWIKTDAATGPGDSGAMVINQAGEIVGVHTQGWSDPETAARLSAERPVNLALEIIRQAQVGQGQIKGAGRKGEEPSAGGKKGDYSFSDLVFSEKLNKARSDCLNPTDHFESGASTIYGCWSYTGMKDGLSWSVAWYLGKKKGAGDTYRWDGGKSGKSWASVTSKSGLPDGEYMLKLSVEGQVIAEGDFTIGQASSNRPFQAGQESVIVQGTVVDADTERGIRGAIFAVLNPGTTLADFEQDPTQDKVYSSGQTDSKGRFELDRPLEREKIYSVIAVAEGYRAVGTDEFAISKSAPSPYELEPIPLQKGR
jgi:S1-C subfamily serine protease